MDKFTIEYRQARDNVMMALGMSPLEARHWLVKHTRVTAEGKAIYWGGTEK